MNFDWMISVLREVEYLLIFLFKILLISRKQFKSIATYSN